MCTVCGLVSHRDIPSDEELARFYRSQYRLEYHGERTPSARRVMRAWKNGERIREQLAPFTHRCDRVLEIGAGLGCTVKCFQDAGFDAEGIDPGRDFITYSRTRLGANVRLGTVGDLEPDERASRDLVLLIHVIEHLNRPVQALARMHEILRPNGLLYVECPNLTGPPARFGRLFHKAHIFNFCESTLVRLAARCGFRLVRRFGAESCPNLQLLFQRDRITAPSGDTAPSSVRDSESIRRRLKMGLFRYHFRPAYLIHRWRQVRMYLRESVHAERFVGQLTAGPVARPSTTASVPHRSRRKAA